jgi:uncharacterized protein YjgD (DUF1641 family)
MKKWLYAGTALLIFQLVLAVIFNTYGRGNYAAFQPHANLLEFSPHDVDAISVTGEGGKEVLLNKVNGSWLMPEHFKAPADEKKVTDFLDKLATVKQGLAVATTAGAAKRFKTSADDFERHVVLKDGDKVVADFFLGTSPGFKMVHARVHDRPEVVSVALNTYDMETDPDSWVNHDMVGVKKDAISHLTMGDIDLTRQGKAWQLAGMAENEELNSAEVDKLVDKVSRLTVAGVLDPATSAELFKQKPALTFTLKLTDNSDRVYTFAKPAKEKYYALKTSGQDQLFKVNNWVADEIKKFTRNTLIQLKPAAADAAKPASPAADKK